MICGASRRECQSRAWLIHHPVVTSTESFRATFNFQLSTSIHQYTLPQHHTNTIIHHHPDTDVFTITTHRAFTTRTPQSTKNATQNIPHRHRSRPHHRPTTRRNLLLRPRHDELGCESGESDGCYCCGVFCGMYCISSWWKDGEEEEGRRMGRDG